MSGQRIAFFTTLRLIRAGRYPMSPHPAEAGEADGAQRDKVGHNEPVLMREPHEVWPLEAGVEP